MLCQSDSYIRAVHYDIAMDRHVYHETRFLIDLYLQGCGRLPRSALDVGCGPGYHARSFAQCGIEATGIDVNPEMIRVARERAAFDKVSAVWQVADMRDFSVGTPVDIAIAAFDSLDGLSSIDDFVDHFRTIAQNLVPDGFYVVEDAHPRDFGLYSYPPTQYEGRRDGCEVKICWPTGAKPDSLRQTVDIEITTHVNDNGKEWTYVTQTTEFCTTPLLLMAMARLSGALTPIAWYGAYNLNQPYDESLTSDRCITVLRHSV